MASRAIAAATLFLLALALPPADASHGTAALPSELAECRTGLTIHKSATVDHPHPISWCRYAVTVDGETAWGYLAYPEDITPTKLVVIAHGCCKNLEPNPGWSEARAKAWGMQNAAARLGVASVGMDFRGPGNFDVWKGHLDTIAATEDLQARWPIDLTLLYGGSMGGTVSGLAAAARPDLYGAWINLEGAVNLFEIFLTFGFMPGVNPGVYVDTEDPTGSQVNEPDPQNPTGSWMVEEMGGLPVTVPQEWIKRSPAFQAHRMVGLPRAYHCYGAGDPYAPITQGLEMHAALTAAGVRSSLFINLVERGGIQGPMRPAVLGDEYGGTWGEPPAEYPAPNGYGGTGVGDPVWIGPAAHDARSFAPCPAIVEALLNGAAVDDGPSLIQVNGGEYRKEWADYVAVTDPTGLVPADVLAEDIAVGIPDEVRVLAGCALQALGTLAFGGCVPSP